ncbi:MAG: hypothetical protein WAK13_14440 [Terriglobales bacterium]
MKCKHILAALACALLALSTVGCGAFKGQTSDLKSITLDVALINGVAPSSQTGFVTLQGNGGTVQLLATGEYTGGTTKDITHVVTYNVTVDPEYAVDAFGYALIPPCQPPSCPVPSEPPYTSGTVEYNQTGLLTAVEPATCTFVDVAANQNGVAQTPSWAYSGDYVVTVSYQGITSNPVFVPIASSTGNPNNPSLDTPTNPTGGVDNNPNELCGSGS